MNRPEVSEVITVQSQPAKRVTWRQCWRKPPEENEIFECIEEHYPATKFGLPIDVSKPVENSGRWIVLVQNWTH